MPAGWPPRYDGYHRRPPMNETELQVVCRSCGREVSPYVTECPYCGTRLRKKAPKLERDESGSLEPVEKPRRKIRPRISLPRPDTGGRPLGSIAIAVLPAVLLLIGTLFGLDRLERGAVGTPSPAEFWRFLAAPFVYDDAGFLFAIGLVVVLFGAQLEARIGTVALVLLLIACGSLGVLGAFAIDDQRGFDTVIAGGTGTALGAVAAFWVAGRREAIVQGERLDWIPILVAGVVVLAMPLVVAGASPWVGPIGAAVGALSGLAIRNGAGE
jgi:membrane associated rhomboid family serine protease/ribosomal protein L40E